MDMIWLSVKKAIISESFSGSDYEKTIPTNTPVFWGDVVVNKSWPLQLGLR